MKRWLVKFALMVVATGAPGIAAAQQCVGFGDILQSSPFCANVEWVKNRGVTLGCGDGSNYCPNDPVTRLQMAIFMNRLGRALSPEILSQQVFDNGGGSGVALPGDSPAPALVRCLTAETAATVYPRHAVANATFSALSDGNPAGYRIFLLVSANNGPFTNFDTVLPSVAHRGTAQATVYGASALTEQIILQPGSSYKFAIGVRRDNNPDVVTTGNFDVIRCQITVTIDNRNGTASPFDAAQ